MATSASQREDIINQISNWNKRLQWDDYFMSLAFLISSRSSCDRLHVGCVLVNANRIISIGYNGFLPGVPHKSIMKNNHEQATIHAEQNAISYAAKNSASINNCTAYITHFPCINCAKLLAASGIKKIKYHDDYKNDPIVFEILAPAGIVIHKNNNIIT